MCGPNPAPPPKQRATFPGLLQLRCSENAMPLPDQVMMENPLGLRGLLSPVNSAPGRRGSQGLHTHPGQPPPRGSSERSPNLTSHTFS